MKHIFSKILLLFYIIQFIPIVVKGADYNKNLTLTIGHNYTISPIEDFEITKTRTEVDLDEVSFLQNEEIYYSELYTEGSKNQWGTYYRFYYLNVIPIKCGTYTCSFKVKFYDKYHSLKETKTVLYNISVVEVNSIVIPSKLSLIVGDTQEINPTIVPNGAETTLAWTSSNNSIVSVSNGNVTALKDGIAIITCVSDNGVSAQCEVKVNPKRVTNISLNYQEYEIEQNQTLQLEANIQPIDAPNKELVWSSSHPSIVLVGPNGKVVALSEGWANISATTTDGSNLSANCLIHVIAPTILASSLSLDIETLVLTHGDKTTLAVTLQPSNVSSTALKWASSDENIVSVDEDGTITALTIGDATISVSTTDGSNLSATCKVNVKSKSITDFDNVVYFNDVIALKNKEMSIPLNLKNKKDITAVQFDLALPNGVTIAMDDKGTAYDITYVEERVDGTTHTLNSALQEDGTVRVLCYSTANELFLGNEGAILNFPILVSDLESGAYNIILQNIVITDINGNKSYIDAIGSILNVLEATPGDANGDNEIDVADIVAVANHILGSSPEDFLVEAADFDSDGTVDVADIVNIANYILGGNISEARILARKVLNAQSVDLGFSFDVLPFVFEEKGTKTVTLDLCNPDVEFTAFQCDLYLPDGLNVDLNRRGTAYNFSFNADADRTDATYHTLSSAKQEDGSIRILCYSTTNEIFLGEEGALLNIPLTADATLKSGVYELSLANIVLTYANGVKVKPEAYKGSILVGDGGEVKIVKLYGRYTADVLDVFSAALSLNTQITSIDLMETVSLEESGALTTGNPNTLIYLSESMMLANESNIVRGEQCSNIQLTDGCPFNVDKSFTATAATYQRTLAKEGWYSLCLPYVANKPAGVTVERFSELDASAGTVVFSEGDIAANVPCIFNAPAGNITFSASDVEIVKTPEKMNDGAFVGVYDKTGEGAIAGSYALFADGSGFGIAGTTAYAEPFRAYIEAESSNAKTLRLIHGETTGVELLEKEAGERSDIYSIDGRYAGRSIEQLPKGIYIINNKKLIK
ncbi:MAG: Ig-like domain-containing protein [Prevotella sp.]|nr:Ig-like domain-containing protein [Prevotella sp.]